MKLTILDILKKIEIADYRKVDDILRELISYKDEVILRDLAEILKTTDNSILRDKIALHLSDIEYIPVVEVIVNLIKDERTNGKRGTLLYAIGNYNCLQIFPQLIDFIINGNFELSRQALAIIYGINSEIEREMRHLCSNQLQAALISASAEREPLIIDAIKIIDNMPNMLNSN
jgi:hypothetical protein